jgi:hypothetical protein
MVNRYPFGNVKPQARLLFYIYLQIADKWSLFIKRFDISQFRQKITSIQFPLDRVYKVDLNDIKIYLILHKNHTY